MTAVFLRRRQPAEHERTEPERIADADEFVFAHDDERVRALDFAHDGFERVGAVSIAGTGEQMQNDLAVDGRLENRALLFEFGAQPRGVGEIAVVADGDLAARAIDDERLGVLDIGTAGGGVADVADGEMAGQRAENVFVEHLADEPHALVGAQVDAVRGGDARAFLAAMLQRVQPVIRQLGRIRVPVNPKQATIMPWPRAFFRVHSRSTRFDQSKLSKVPPPKIP